MKSLTTFFSNITTGKGILLVLTPILSTIISMKALLLGLVLLIFLDLITGIRKSIYLERQTDTGKSFWKCLKSYMLRKTYKKTYEYALGIISVLILESLVLGTTTVDILDKSFTISELAVLVPAVVEVWSIYENMEAVSGSNILKKAKKYVINKLLKKIESQ